MRHPNEPPNHNIEIGTEYELQQREDYDVPPLVVHVAAPVQVHQLPTRLAVSRTVSVLAPEAILPNDKRRARAVLLASTQGLRLSGNVSDLKSGGVGRVGVASGGTGAQFSSSGGGTGGFLLPVGMILTVTLRDILYACSDDYGVGNNPCMLSLMIEQWAD